MNNTKTTKAKPTPEPKARVPSTWLLQLFLFALCHPFFLSFLFF